MKKLLMITFVTVLFTGCSLNPWGTSGDIDQPDTGDSSDDGILDDAFADDDFQASGSERIRIENTNSTVNDQGTRLIGYTGELTSEKIVEWLEATGTVIGQEGSIQNEATGGSNRNPENTTEIKQVQIHTSAGSLTFINGAGLEEFITCVYCETTTNEGNLTITAQGSEQNNAYLVIHDSLTTAYQLENPQDRFGGQVYTIPSRAFSLVEIFWGSDAENITLKYEQEDTTHTLEELRGSFYEGYAMNPKLVGIPAGETITLGAKDKEATGSIYRVDYREGGSNVLGDFTTMLSKDGNELFAHNALNHLSQLTSFPDTYQSDAVTRVSEGTLHNQEITISDAPYQIFFIVERGFTYMIGVDTTDFSVDINWETDQYDPYRFSLESNRMLEEESTNESIQTLFNSGSSLQSLYAMKLQPVPDVVYSGNLTFHSVFGETHNFPVNYSIDELSSQVIIQEIVANTTMSILPETGIFKDVLIQYKNIEQFDVQFEACQMRDSVDFLSGFQGSGLENYLFDCDTSTRVTRTVEPVDEEFTYRNAYRTPLAIPENMEQYQAYRVFFKDAQGREQTHYFVRSDIGLWTKIDSQGAHVWGFSLTNGDPLMNGMVTVRRLDGTLVDEVTVDEGYGFVELPPVDSSGSWNERGVDNSYILEWNGDEESAFVLLNREGNDAIQVAGNAWGDQSRNMQINSKLSAEEVLSEDQESIPMWSTFTPLKVYGYANRGMYKVGDEIHLAGFVRDILESGESSAGSGIVDIALQPPGGGDAITLSGVNTDEYGGFSASYTIPEGASLGDYLVEYQLRGKTDVTYSHIVKVEEYQKPTFSSSVTTSVDDGTRQATFNPEYFFQEPVASYDLNVTWSVVPMQNQCGYMCRWNDQEGYENYRINSMESRSGRLQEFDLSGESSVDLYEVDNEFESYARTLKVEAMIRDKTSDEVQFVTEYFDIAPTVSLEFNGYPYTWLYDLGSSNNREDFILEGSVVAGQDAIDNLSYEVYYRNYGASTKQGVDGNLYYFNDQEYRLIESESVDEDSDQITIPTDFIDKPGSYIVSLIAKDDDGNVIGQVDKNISWYSFSDEGDDLLGAVPNNYALLVDVPKETYQVGDEIPINLAPYQDGAHVVVTVEKGQYLLDRYTMELDGSQITIPVKENYAPNVVVSVMQLQSTEQNDGARQEPRFFAGYADVAVDQSYHELEISTSFDQEEYRPGEEVTIDFEVRNYAGELVDARLSVSVVDQALANLYYQIKEPIPYFYSRLGTSLFTYTNMKLLYQSLKAFATGGVKGGDGGAGKSMIGYIREELEDTAYWNPSVVIEDGRGSVTFTLPENLTTWMVDVVGITKGTQFGTVTDQFTVTQPFVIEANPPLFMVPGDSIALPIRAVDVDGGVSEKINGRLYVENAFGSGGFQAFTMQSGKRKMVMLSIPEDWQDSPFITVTVTGESDEFADGVEYTIPLRDAGMQARESFATLAQSGTGILAIPSGEVLESTITMSVLPIEFADRVIEYFVKNDYDSSEQLMTRIRALLTTQQGVEADRLTSKYIRGGAVFTEEGVTRLQKILDDTVSVILSRQLSSGAFTYWNDPESQNNATEEATERHYMLTAYLYGALLDVRDNLSATQTNNVNQALDRARDYLWKYRGSYADGYLYWLVQKALFTGQIDQRDRQEISGLAQNTGDYKPLMRYLIAVFTDNQEVANQWRQVATIPTNRSDWSQFSIYMNQTIAESLRVRAYLNDTGVDQEALQEDLIALTKNRQSNGLWGVSSQTNYYALQALLVTDLGLEEGETISCDFGEGNQDERRAVSLDNENPTVVQELTVDEVPDGGIQQTVDRSCDRPVMVDIITQYRPDDIEDLVNHFQNVGIMEWTISEQDPSVGEVVTIGGSFSTETTGEQVAVDLHVPAEYKLLNVIRSRNNNDSMPFTVSDQHCYPDHRETRFDKLFLYYETLQSGTCDITIEALKAYEGDTTIMPFTIKELYRGSVYGRKLVDE